MSFLCRGTPGDVVYSGHGFPPGIDIDSTGLIAGTLPFSAAGRFNVTVYAFDGVITGTQSADWTVLNIDTSPVIDFIVNQTRGEGVAVAQRFAASDQDGDIITYAATGLPAGLLIDPTSGIVSGSIDYSAASRAVPFARTRSPSRSKIIRRAILTIAFLQRTRQAVP